MTIIDENGKTHTSSCVTHEKSKGYVENSFDEERGYRLTDAGSKYKKMGKSNARSKNDVMNVIATNSFIDVSGDKDMSYVSLRGSLTPNPNKRINLKNSTPMSGHPNLTLTSEPEFVRYRGFCGNLK